ncbi:DUF1848 domain-containing protein [Aeromonas enteropelogenes]|uniref:DUF1848 domain-containing protein n=1 Tax=Aeromonas enteropelogenes TaxID=29489 RepID=A0ABU9JB14_AEREN
MIISASRRTDIPAFYTPWWMNRIRAGFLLTRNPFNAHQISRVSLHPEEVDAIVFWTRQPAPLMGHLDELDALGHRYYFQYTLTGYPRALESRVPRPHHAIHTFCALSDRVGANRVIWRYDPILLCNLVSLIEHKRLFYKIAALLAGKTHRVVISVVDLYKKTEKNLNAVEGLIVHDLLGTEWGQAPEHHEALDELAAFMAQTAARFDMTIETCAEAVDLAHLGIPHGKCIDDQLIQALFGRRVDGRKDPGQREACGCVKSIDIGAYNTCLHGCTYCYATYSQSAVIKNRQRHDPQSPFLIGGTEGVDTRLLVAEPLQKPLF